MHQNLSLLTDYYELTMMQGYFNAGMRERTAVFDLFYRKNPSGNGYSIAAGLEQAIEYINNLSFDEEDIAYLRDICGFTGGFLEYLRGFEFHGDIYAVPEGTVVFPNEPLLRIRAPIMEAQLLETSLLNIINHQSLIATKASRVVQSAEGDGVLEFGLRRAQGPDAGTYGTRAAMIGGCMATSNVLAGRLFGVPVRGTHAHSWVMSFPDELTAFTKYAEQYPEQCVLLVDTYDTLRSGVPNAIKVFSKMREAGKLTGAYGIRLDSGDLAYLSKEARRMLDGAGLTEASISASGDLDEYLIRDLKTQGAKINIWGVGTNLITSMDCPAFGGVYKIALIEGDEGDEGDGSDEGDQNVGNVLGARSATPKIKLSDDPIKVTNPGIKKIYRLYDRKTKKMKADLVTLEDEKIDNGKDLTIFDPQATWKLMTLRANSFTVRELLQPIFIGGKCVYKSPGVMEIRDYAKTEIDSVWDEYKRLINPNIMPVDLSQKLYDLKMEMILRARRQQ